MANLFFTQNYSNKTVTPLYDSYRYPHITINNSPGELTGHINSPTQQLEYTSRTLFFIIYNILESITNLTHRQITFSRVDFDSLDTNKFLPTSIIDTRELTQHFIQPKKSTLHHANTLENFIDKKEYPYQGNASDHALFQLEEIIISAQNVSW